MKNLFYSIIVIIMSVSLTGCRGYKSEKPPVHPNVNMDYQPKYKKQSLPLEPPEGVMPYSYESTDVQHESRDYILQDSKTGYYTAKLDGDLVKTAPIVVTEAVLKNGQERYNIYCAVCHGQTGKGDGMVVQRGYLKPPSLSDQRLIDSPDGHLYDVIANGIRNMPAYGDKIAVSDRWAVVTYIRALQRVNNATLDDVPDSQRETLLKERPL